ncbi:MAG: 2-amino-4-hydroxy-6-hydroxymethyldihydropteridine diphosphokinase, partial [Gammaproteobacteria bacterium]|nr:2-amino-4-hydroxy-6-hydroxymethyldihydropteridine diphosphokinase [Gammaproteobacteria bacterium]
MVKAFIGLGSNLNSPRLQLENALQELAQLPKSQLTCFSSLYETAPMGPVDQPDYVQPGYINAVAELETELAPEALLDQLQLIESVHQRVRGEVQWGPRTLDLDLLLYGEQIIETGRLSVPHPGLTERNFVLIPLYEIRADLKLPDGRAIADLPA